VFLLDKLRRVIAAAVPYLLVTAIVSVLFWWFAHPNR
jgi:hypothetical protein